MNLKENGNISEESLRNVTSHFEPLKTKRKINRLSPINT